MKFQTTPEKLKGKWTYQAQFHDPNAMKRAKEWLAFRPYNEVKFFEGVSLYTNCLQTIFELRVHFGENLRVIRQYLPK